MPFSRINFIFKISRDENRAKWQLFTGCYQKIPEKASRKTHRLSVRIVTIESRKSMPCRGSPFGASSERVMDSRREWGDGEK